MSTPSTRSVHGEKRPVLVQKFGGSSVASDEGRGHILEHVQRALQEGYRPVLVVSAMGRRPAPYATDTLLDLVAFARHEHDKRELDMLMACGETLSVVYIAHFLRAHGIPAAALAGVGTGFATDANYGEALIEFVDPHHILAVVEQGKVAVVAGFQGLAPDGTTTTLGRGGSDTSAVAVGIAVGACAVEIFSDVEGVMTVDPRVYAGARLVSRLSYEELGELAVEGAKVMHPRSVDLAGAHSMPMRIRSTFLRTPGTLVESGAGRDVPRQGRSSGKPVASSQEPAALFEQQRVVTSMTTVGPVALFDVSTGRAADPDAQRCMLLGSLAEQGVSLDLINVGRGDLFFVVRQEQVPAVVALLQTLDLGFQLRSDCTKLSLVGVAMRGTAGVMARIQAALHRSGIPLLHSTDSNITISCLIDQSQGTQAIVALHDEFHLDAQQPALGTLAAV